MDNDSDFYDGMPYQKDSWFNNIEYSQETESNQHNSASNILGQVKRPHNSFSVPFNEEFEMKREKLVSILL